MATHSYLGPANSVRYTMLSLDPLIWHNFDVANGVDAAVDVESWPVWDDSANYNP